MATGQLLDLLQELRAELQVHNNPERQARARLKPNRQGWTEAAYADEAFRIWEGLLRQFPNDLTTLHHLAIMHHARAIDLEQSDDPSRSDADWRRALELWHRLYAEDAFWVAWARHIDDGVKNPFPQVRAALPAQILQLHFDIAADEQSKHYRARQHVRLALDAPFPQQAKDRVRLRTYERMTAHLPMGVWESFTFDAETLEEAIEAVTHYLDLDEEFLPALKDLLDLLTRLQTGHVQQTNATGSTEEFRQNLQEVRSLSSRYDSHIRRLEQLLQQVNGDLPANSDGADDGLEASGMDLHQLKSDALSNLVLWHSRVGQALRLLEDYEAGAVHYRRAFEAADQGGADEERREEMRKDWLLGVAQAAREHAVRDETGQTKARELLESIAGETGLSAMCLMVRANTLMFLKQFDAAERDCEEALTVLEEEKNGIDSEAAENAAMLEPECEKLLDAVVRARRQHATRSYLDQASDAIEQNQWDTALERLNQAARIDPDGVLILYLRAQCHLKQLDAERARADIERAQRLAEKEDDEDALNALRLLRKDLDALRKQINLYGGVKSLRLQQQAIEAFNNNQPQRAAELLRQAIKVARPNGRGKLEEELHLCLERAAADAFQPAIERAKAGDFAGARSFCDKSLQIDPDYFPALFLRAQCYMDAEDLDAAMADINRAEAAAKRDSDHDALKATSELRRQLQQMQQRVNEYGGVKAFRLQQQAVEAFNTNQPERAVRLLRQALNVARPGGDRKLKQELALCLDGLAVQKANEAVKLLESNL